MLVYHMGSDLAPELELQPDYHRTSELIKPFIDALEIDKSSFRLLLIQARYLRAVMRKHKMREWSNSSKWATEGIFEWIRKNEFINCNSRIRSCFFYETIVQCELLYQEDYLKFGDEDGIELFEVELKDDNIQKYDMDLYNEAYSTIENEMPIDLTIELARKYWNNINKIGNFEVVSNRPAIIKRKIMWRRLTTAST